MVVLDQQESSVQLKGNKAHFTLLRFHISREFLLNFAVSFTFFFFIFFINQILLLVKKVMLKNVDIFTVLTLVVCAIPQFLLYVIPFATLSASSMVLGDLGANNELLAMRSVGISLSRVYQVLITMALIMSLITFLIADLLVPWSARTYRDMLSDVMRELPTFEIKSNSVNTVGDIVMSNGLVEGDTIKDLLIINNASENEQTLLSKEGHLELIDPFNFIYRLDLTEPNILFTDSNIDSYGLSDSSSATVYLNFSSQVPTLTSQSPSQLSSKELRALIAERDEVRRSDIAIFYQERESAKAEIADSLSSIKSSSDYNNVETLISDNLFMLESALSKKPINFYFQYYTAELHKKMVLSLACLSLVVISLPLSFFRIRYGRLSGFGLSLLIAVLYWYFLFGVQLKIFDVTFSSAFLMWIPDVTIFIIGLLLLFLRRRSA